MAKNNFKKSKTNDKFRGVFPLEFDDKSEGDSDIPDKIHLVPMGQWEHDLYGPIIINNADIREFIQNFNAGIRKGVFITAGHEGFDEKPAVGWIKEVEARSDGLWGTVDWNNSGITALEEKEFKFFSPEMCRDYEDPQTHQFYRNVLTGGALTKSPYFKELQAIVFSDKNIKSNLKNKETMSKTLEEVLALEVEALTEEDKAVLKENENTLSDEQKAKYFPAPAETDEEKTAREAKEAEEKAAAEKKAADDAAAAGGEQAMSEKNMVKINASELEILRKKANEGALAFAELEKKNLTEAVEKLVYSESNKEGRFLPKSMEKISAFMGKLSKEQKESFSALIAELPNQSIFKEIGSGGGAEVNALKEVESKVDAKMKANDKLPYAEALKQVFAENTELQTKYEAEVNSGKK